MLTLPPDPYLALKVERDAGLPEIRTAYRKLILKCHPDKIQDPLQKQLKQDEFQKVQSAYELLSSDVEKSRYDNMYKLNQLEKERSRMDTSAPGTGRSSRRERDSDYPNVRVHMAEPRPNSYSNSPFSSPSKGYAAGTPPSRSYEEVYTTYEPAHPPRKTASYESARGYKTDWEKRSPRDERDDKYERKSKKEDKKDHEKSKGEKEEKRKEREKDLKRAERKEKEKEKERAERKEKERAERKEKEKKEKKAEQLRKKDADVKAAQAKVYPSQKYPAAAYSSSSEDDEPKPMRRASGTRDTREEAPPGASERERKYSETIEVAADYLARSGAKVSINSSRPKPQATEHFAARHIQAIPTAPTPPVVGGPFAPPPPAADLYEEDEPHRASKGSGRRAEKSYKKSGARASSRDPASVEYTHRPPPLQHSATMPIRSRQTETAYNIGRPMPPSLNRAQTFQESSSRYPRERSRSRTRRYHSDDEDSDGDRHARHSRSHRSPERTAPTKIRYAVGSDKTSTRQISSEDMSRHHKSSKSGYPTANTGVRMDPDYSHYSAATPGKIRYAPTFDAGEVKYASYNVREEPVYTY